MTDHWASDLQTQIESINNTRDFEKLVNDLFSRIHGTDYFPSDYHKDAGLDGYIRSSKTLIAKHCFENPIPRKANRDNEILKKARADLKKASELSKDLDIEKWIFITPYPIPSSVFIKLNDEAAEFGFELSCPGPSFICQELTKNKDLLQNHPYLHVGQINECIKSISEDLSTLVTLNQINDASSVVEKSSKHNLEKVIATEESKLFTKPFKPASTDTRSKDFKRILEIYNCVPNLELEKETKAIIYSTSDQEAVLQGIHLLASWYKFSNTTIEDHLTFINIGIDTARSLKSLDSEAVLLAERASLLSSKFVMLDLEGWGQIQISNAVGIPVITSDEKSKIIEELNRLNKEFSQLFKDAITKSYESKSYLAIIRTFSRIGDAAGNRAGHFMALSIKERAIAEQRLSKSSFMYAKKVATQYNDEKELAYTLYNFANALGFTGETAEALLVLNQAIVLAEKYKMTDILSNRDRLVKLINEPKIQLSDLGNN